MTRFAIWLALKGPLSRENRDVIRTRRGGLLGPAVVPGRLVLAFCWCSYMLFSGLVTDTFSFQQHMSHVELNILFRAKHPSLWHWRTLCVGLSSNWPDQRGRDEETAENHTRHCATLLQYSSTHKEYFLIQLLLFLLITTTIIIII